MNHAEWGRNLSVLADRMKVSTDDEEAMYIIVLLLKNAGATSISQATAAEAVLVAAAALGKISWPVIEPAIAREALSIFKHRVTARRLLDGSLDAASKQCEQIFHNASAEHQSLFKSAMVHYQSTLKELGYPDTYGDPDSPIKLD